MQRRKGERLKETVESQVPFGPSKFVCDLMMVESIKCVPKMKTKRRNGSVKTHLMPKDSNSPTSRPSQQSQSVNPSGDKSGSSILKISVDLWPVLSMAVEPLKMDQHEISYDDLKMTEIGLSNEIKTDKHLKEVKSMTINKKLKLHQVNKPIMGSNKIVLPPLKSSILPSASNFDKCIKPCCTMPHIDVSEKHPLDFAHAKSKIELEYEETKPRFLKTDAIKNILSQNMAPQLQLPDISVSSIQMLIERVERQLDRGKIKLPEIKLPQAQREMSEMSARISCSPPLHEKNVNQLAILRFHKETHNFPWSVNK
ncbi:hypothetical protein AALO_G00125250 [Alosa alosa]|uniref:Uncharacterized protein n=1 Tax=Alosa alosa TaxID=278164 RepID=A0AAV6GLT7_9TELE|nr:uncharacterized protein LOC125301039 isoform X2 [Alosa alosa]KAG5275850.1 hypothetical protein AALO_G00125250 [Alosa alosa]